MSSRENNKGYKANKSISVSAYVTLALLLLLTGCTTVKITRFETVSLPLEQGDSITIVLDNLGKDREPDKVQKLEMSFCDCLERELQKANIPIKLIPSKDFRQALFSDLSTNEAVEAFQSLSSPSISSDFLRKTDPMKLRYLVIVAEQTYSGMKNSGGDALAMGVEVEKITNIRASIKDMRFNKVSEIKIDVDSNGFYGFITYLPMIWPPASESKACKRLGSEIVTYIKSGAGKELVENK
jgi:hypothetical protein